MKKVGIISLCGNFNYGNKLQNYALQEILKKMDCKVSSIWTNPYKKFSKMHLKVLFQSFKDFINFLFHRNDRFIFTMRFIKFNNKYLSYMKDKVYSFQEKKISRYNLDKFFIGSDQVWNYSFPNDNFGDIEFALQAPKEKCFSYAASFGISNIPKEMEEVYKTGLEHLNKISVREQSGVDLVKKISGRADAKLVLDPTMLLSSEEWSKIAKKPNFIKDGDKYILLYFVGNMLDINSLRIMAKERNYKIIDIHPQSYCLYHTGPVEFVYLLKNAEMIVTDSFHACAFSMIFSKPFYVFKRKDNVLSMISRIDSLLQRYDLSSRKISSINDIKFDDFNISKKAIQKLNDDRINSIKYLEDCIK